MSGVGIGLTTGVTGLTTDKMTQPANFNANLLNTFTIIEGKTLPYLKYQAAPVYVIGATPLLAKAEILSGGSDSIRIYREESGVPVYLGTSINSLTEGTKHTIDLSSYGIQSDDILLFVNYKNTGTVWSPSYPVSAKVQKFLGEGSEANPYQIYTAQELANLNQYLGDAYKNTHFRLMNDIDLTSYLAAAGNDKGAGWEPIGKTSASAFQGRFHGGGHTISGLWINRPSTANTGLFGYLGDEASIDSLGVITAENNMVKGENYAGILAGSLSGNIAYCYTMGTVTGTGYYVGGLIGSQSGGSIISCYSTGEVIGNECAGGLVGSQSGGSITFSYSAGAISGNNSIGGFVGWQSGGTSLSCYFNTETSGQNKGVGSDADATGVTGLITSGMMQEANLSGLDFNTAFSLDENKTYPYLQWQATRGLSNEYALTAISYDYNNGDPSGTLSLSNNNTTSIKLISTEKDIVRLSATTSTNGFLRTILEPELSTTGEKYTAIIYGISQSGIVAPYSVEVMRDILFINPEQLITSYTGSEIKLKPDIYYGATLLEESVDYTLTYQNNTNIGNATITVTGKGKYAGKSSFTFFIVTKDILLAVDVASILPETYTGNEIKPEPEIKDGAMALEKDKDYTLSYQNNINAGTATVIIMGKGKYSGVKSVNFIINKAPAVVPKSLPQNLTAVYGDRFRDVKPVLPDNFRWPNPSSPVGNASSYPVSVPILYNPDTKNYEDYQTEVDLMIYPAISSEPVFPTANPISIVYDPERTLSSINLIEGSESGRFAWRYPNTVPVVGNSDYEVIFIPNNAGNHDYSGVEGWDSRSRTVIRTVSLTVIPRDIEITLLCSETKTYTGLPIDICEAEVTLSELRSSTAATPALKYEYFRNGVLQESVINAGVYEVIAHSADPNYKGQSAPFSFSVEKAQPVIHINDTIAKYTGEPIAIAYAISGSHTASGLSRTLTFSYEGLNDMIYGPTIEAPAEIGEYKIYVSTPGSINHFPATTEASLKIVSGVSIDRTASESFRLYPNPVTKNSKLFLEKGERNKEKGEVFVEVYDTNGSLLRKIQVTDNKTELRSENKEGVYLYVLRSNAGITESVKVVVK